MASRKPRHPSSHPRPQSPDREVQLESRANEFLAHYRRKEFDLAQPIAESLTREFPGSVFGWKALGTCLMESGAPDEAIAPLERSLAIKPNDAQAHSNLAKTYQKLGQPDQMQQHLQQALEIDPDNYQANVRIADYYAQREQSSSAIKHLDISLEANPDSVIARIRKANALVADRNFDQALAILEPLVRERPMDPSIHSNLANLYATMGRFSEAERLYRRAIELAPNHPIPFSNYYFTAHYNPTHDIDAFLDIARQWQDRFAPDYAPPRPTNDTTPDRQLRVGLVSSGLRSHPVGQMITSTLEHLDRSDFALFAYSNKPTNDQIARRIQARVDSWLEVPHMSDEDLAAKIREDRIDILIDMTGHTSGNRLKTITDEPAPVIVKWVGGLFNTMGVESFDYLISDHIETPDGVDTSYFEKLIRLPDDYICFAPPDYAPDVGQLPALRNGHITFGCFNNPAKLNDTLLIEWARLMHQLPASRLLLKGGQYTNGPYCEGIYSTLEGHGIARERITLEGPVKHQALMETYNRVDIALDTWPYSGGLTTCEALLMGVPVVTLPGPTFAGRHSATHLVNAGMPELVTQNWDEYRERAIELASDLESLQTIRQHLRDTLLKSPVCDAPRFAGHFTTAMRAIWQRHCEGRPPCSLSLDQQGQAWFEDDDLPIALQHPGGAKAENDFRWQFDGKVIAIDNGARMLSHESLRQMLQHGTLELIVFDPASQAMQHPLKSQEGVHYYPNASLGDGGPAQLHVCQQPAMSGTLKPLASDGKKAGDVGAEVITRLPINTIALNKIEGLPCIDWLALDARNDSIRILEHGDRALADALLLQARVAFQPTHERQPDLTQVNHWACRHGFRFYRLSNARHSTRLPARDDISSPTATELTSADALFIPDASRMATLDDNQRMKLAFILHSCFDIKDLSHELVTIVAPELAEAYLQQAGITETPARREVAAAPSPTPAAPAGNGHGSADGKIEDEIIFVIGCGHSGTTLMASILGAHPEIYSIPRETYWFLNNPKVDTEYPEEKRLCLEEGKRIVCEKTPRHVYRIDQILAKFPNAKFVAMLREGRDVVASLKNRSGSFKGGLERWVADNTALLKHADNPRVQMVKYEDLVTDQEGTMRRTFDFLELPYSRDVFDYHKKEYNWFGVKDARETDGVGPQNHLMRRSWQMTQPIQDKRGTWKEKLTREELKTFTRFGSDMMISLGYHAYDLERPQATSFQTGELSLPTQPHMSDAEAQLFLDALRQASRYYEFGTGGSSVWAVREGLKVHGVDSSADWVDMLNHELGEASALSHADIGPTKDWGYPASEQYRDRFPSYSQAIFQHDFSFDLILVDGRFRVACTLSAIRHIMEHSNAPSSARIFIHDFWDRPIYHIVLDYLEPIESVESAGLFRLKESLDINEVNDFYQRYACISQ